MPLITNSNISAGATNTPYVGPSQYGGVMFPRGQILFSNTNTQNQLYLSSNAYTNANGVFAYRNSSQPATFIGQDNGGVAIGVAGNGTADSVINFTSSISVNNNGNVIVGGTTAQTKFHVKGGSDYNTTFESDSNRSGWVINEPGTTNIKASGLVLKSDLSFRFGTNSYYHMAMMPNGTTNIYNTSENPAIQVTPEGYVLKPLQPSFVAHKSSNQEPDSDTLLSYDIVTINRGGHYNASISRFTAPVTGIYAFGVKVWFKTNSTGTIWVHLRKNGAVFTEQRMSLPTAAGDFNTFFPKWVYGLSAGDYIEVSGYGNNSNFHSSQTERYSQFYGHLLH
jgi:hypothetical protein